MTREEMQSLQTAHREGASIQALVQFSTGFGSQWVDTPSPMWRAGTEYRIKPNTEKAK